MAETISNNHYSHDSQLADAMTWLALNHPDTEREVLARFPEWANRQWSGAWLDTDAMGVDVEWSSWLTDAVEETGLVWWEEGEPWAGERGCETDDDHAWTYYASRFAGTPMRECSLCGERETYWETDDEGDER